MVSAAPPTPPPTSPAPRRVQPPRWLDLRLAAGVALVLLAVVVGARVFSSATSTERALAVTHDLATGTVLTADDLAVVDAKVPDGHYLRAQSDAVGKVLARPLGTGELLPRAALRPAPALITLTVPLADGNAPELKPGQRIEVWLSTPACPSVVLLADVPVQRARTASAAFGSGTGQQVVISVAPDLAQRVMTALAIEKAVLRAGVLTGSSAPDAGTLPPLADCVTPGR